MRGGTKQPLGLRATFNATLITSRFRPGRSATRTELEGFQIDPHETRAQQEEALEFIVRAWTEEEFDKRMEGSAIRRIGHERWLRNIAVALGNAPRSESARAALLTRASHPSELVREHVGWALSRQS